MTQQNQHRKEDAIISDFQTDDRVKQFWNITKKYYLSTQDIDGNVILYDGADKDELAAFYPSELLE